MTQSLDVEYQELMARADEIEAPLPKLPIGNPQAPCNLSFVLDAAVQIALNADSLRLYIQACEREWRSLAKSLRNAAKAYEDVDEEGAEDINAINMDGTSGSAAKMLSADKNDETLFEADYTPIVTSPPPPAPFEYPYYEVRQAANDIVSPDQGTAFKAFASDWNKYQLAFQQLAYRFRPFLRWEGDARDAVESNFAAHKTWVLGMANHCTTLAKQAQAVADAHQRIKPTGNWPGGNSEWDVEWGEEGEHPAPYEVWQCDWWYQYYTQTKSSYLYMAIDWYKKLQKKSETAISTYISYAGIPLPALNPTAPTGAYVIEPPKPDDGGGDTPVVPNVPDTPSDPWANMPTTPTTPTLPTLPTLPTAGMGGTPSTPDAQAMVDDAMKKAGLSKGGPGGVKPASLGGAAGMPRMPLQPATGGDAAPRPAAAGPGAGTAGLGKAQPGAGGMGGGMGGMPMGGQGGKGGEGKGKRVQGEDDDSLYTEERAWTEGVIGNRPRKGPSEK
jgi:ESX-1 secreted protein B PE domain